MPPNREIANALKLARDVILVQSNVFIKELLLSRQIRGGTTKADFADQMEVAISAGELTYADLRAWVDQTEGWGDEHVYLYATPERLDWLLDPSAVRKRVAKAGLQSVLGADTSLEFPQKRKLTGIQIGEHELTIGWHQGTATERRATARDFDRVEDDGEHYFYRAFRETKNRSVTRVVVRPRVVAVFLPSETEPKTHGLERATLAEEVKAIVDFVAWPLFSMSRAIALLDKAVLDGSAGPFIRTKTTRFEAKAGGHLEFASATDRSYGDVEALREVRNALPFQKFKGADGDFRFALDSQGSTASGVKERLIKVQLYHAYDRIRTWARLTREETWRILDAIPKQRR